MFLAACLAEPSSRPRLGAAIFGANGIQMLPMTAFEARLF
jgi:hypothetical protein